FRQTPKDPPARLASSAHTYRLLIFKDRLRIHYRTSARFNHPAPLRSASLHQQQRNEIMKNFRYVVNRFFNFLNPPTSLKALPLLALPPPVPRCPKHERARF
ncbi:hypothetical protein, partial [Paraburkholderia domus]